jgi:hypothetical protein
MDKGGFLEDIRDLILETEDIGTIRLRVFNHCSRIGHFLRDLQLTLVCGSTHQNL